MPQEYLQRWHFEVEILGKYFADFPLSMTPDKVRRAIDDEFYACNWNGDTLTRGEKIEKIKARPLR